MKILLAPMDGLTDVYAREILTQVGGFDYCVTEFLRVTDALFPRRVFYKRFPELNPDYHDGSTTHQRCISYTHTGIPVFLQLLGSDPSAMAENAAKATELGAYGIDLNFGCPAKVVNRRDGGASLLQYPERIHKIVQTVRQAVPSRIPVTAKMRLGYQDRSLTLENAQAIEAGGAYWLTVHARTKKDGYRPPAYWEALAPINDILNIPVIANGEIWSVEDYELCQQRSHCNSIMIGRGAMVKPYLAKEIKYHLSAGDNQEAFQPLSWTAVCLLLIDLFERMSANQELPERYIAPRLKLWVKWLMPTYEQAEAIFDKLKVIKDSKQAVELIKHYRS